MKPAGYYDPNHKRNDAEKRCSPSSDLQRDFLCKAGREAAISRRYPQLFLQREVFTGIADFCETIVGQPIAHCDQPCP
jgi:hypothetical protein